VLLNAERQAIKKRRIESDGASKHFPGSFVRTPENASLFPLRKTLRSDSPMIISFFPEKSSRFP